MRNAAPVIVFIVALTIASLGVAVGSMGILMGLLSQDADSMLVITMSVSVMALTVVVGLGLAWQARQAIKHRESRAFEPRRIWLWALLFVLLVGAGQMILASGRVPRAAFPFIHVAAGALPPLFFLTAVGRGLGSVTRNRDVVLEVGSGAFLSTFLAVCIELAFLVVLVGAVLGVMIMKSDGLVVIQDLIAEISGPDWVADPSSLAPLARSPIVVAAVVLAVALIVPLVEEAVKTAGVGLRMYRQPSLPEALLWGVACGAGFALVEGLLNTIAGLDAWAAVVLLRVGATLLHCFTGALMGVAWYLLVRRRQVWRALGLFLTSVMVHGLWNLLSVTMSLRSLATLDDQASPVPHPSLGAGELVAPSLLIAMALAVGLALVMLVSYARVQWQEPDPREGDPA